MSKDPQFQLRNEFHEIEGTFSKTEILRRISSGSLSGQEEISQPPSGRWTKLAAHPDFYDAFIKRLFKGQYTPANMPDIDEEGPKDDSASHRNDRATRQVDPVKTRAGKKDNQDDRDPGRTRQINPELGGNATIHQSDIDELFSDVKAPGTAIVKLDEPAAPGDLTLPMQVAESTQRLDFSSDVRTPEPEEYAAAPEPEVKPKRKSRTKIYAAVLVIGLILLFQMGKDETPTKQVEDTKSKMSALGAGETKESRIRALVEEGDSLYLSDTGLAYKAALDIYREAQAYDETNSVISGKIAQSAARLLPEATNGEQLRKEIKSVLDRGRVSDPHSSNYYRAEAMVALSDNKNDEARRLMINAAEADPISPENYLVTGEVLYSAGDLQSARVSLEESVKAFPGSVRAFSFLAQVANDQGDIVRVKSASFEALRLNPLHPASYLSLADATAALGNAKEARTYYETCGKLAKFGSRETIGRAYFKLAKLNDRMGNSVSSQRDYLLAYYYFPKQEGLNDKVAALDTSAKNLQELVEENTFGKDYFQEQGESLLKANKPYEAVKFFQAARLANDKDGMSLIRLGEVTEKTAGSYDDFRRVMNLYQRAIEKDPSLAKGYVKLGTLESEQYNFDRAYKLLTQAVALAPSDAEPYVALGKHYYKRQDYSEALNQFLKAAKLNPNDSEISYYAGLLRLLFKKEGIKDAQKFFYQAYMLDTQNYDALVEWLKLKVLNYEKNFAIKFVRNLLDSDPTNAQLNWAMGEVYASNKEFRRAISYYHRSLDLDNRSSKVRMSLARSLESIGDLEQAVVEFRTASQLDRRNSDGFYRAADLLFQMKRYNESEEVLKYLVNVTPNYPGAHRYLSKVFQVRKQKDPAIAMMLKEVLNNPQNVKFRIELAELYMEYEKFDLAIQELTEVTNLPSITKAPEFVYDKIRGYLLLSRCYRAQNKPESAEAAIRLALEIDSSDPELHRELGYVYYALQRDKEGVRAFEFYLSRNPAARDADTIKGLIQQMIIEE